MIRQRNQATFFFSNLGQGISIGVFFLYSAYAAYFYPVIFYVNAVDPWNNNVNNTAPNPE